jgi:hypothetical protein
VAAAIAEADAEVEAELRRQVGQLEHALCEVEAVAAEAERRYTEGAVQNDRRRQAEAEAETLRPRLGRLRTRYAKAARKAEVSRARARERERERGAMHRAHATHTCHAFTTRAVHPPCIPAMHTRHAYPPCHIRWTARGARRRP